MSKSTFEKGCRAHTSDAVDARKPFYLFIDFSVIDFIFLSDTNPMGGKLLAGLYVFTVEEFTFWTDLGQ